jgi:hypothetical protein
MGWTAPPAYRLAAAGQRTLGNGSRASISADGLIRPG